MLEFLRRLFEGKTTSVSHPAYNQKGRVNFDDQLIHNQKAISAFQELQGFSFKANYMVMEMSITSNMIAEKLDIDKSQPVCIEVDMNSFKRNKDDYLALQTKTLFELGRQMEFWGQALPLPLRLEDYDLDKIEILKAPKQENQPYYSPEDLALWAKGIKELKEGFIIPNEGVSEAKAFYGQEPFFD